MLHFEEYNEHQIFVTIEKVLVAVGNDEYEQSAGYSASFRIDARRSTIIVGEYLRDGRRPRWFGTWAEGVNAALKEARSRIDALK
jgi:hypothetical protein